MFDSLFVSILSNSDQILFIPIIMAVVDVTPGNTYSLNIGDNSPNKKIQINVISNFETFSQLL